MGLSGKVLQNAVKGKWRQCWVWGHDCGDGDDNVEDIVDDDDDNDDDDDGDGKPILWFYICGRNC